MTIFPINGEQLPLPTYQTANLTPPNPSDNPLSEIELERRRTEIARTQHETALLWQAHTLERRQVVAALMVADQVETGPSQSSVA